MLQKEASISSLGKKGNTLMLLTETMTMKSSKGGSNDDLRSPSMVLVEGLW